MAVSCSPEKRLERNPIPEDRIDCVILTDEEGRPKLDDLHVIPWDVLQTAAREGGWSAYEALTVAETQFRKYVKSQYKAEEKVGEYIFRLEDRVFRCANDAEWLRDRENKLDQEGR